MQAETFIPCFYNLAVVRQTIQQRRRHLRVMKNLGPFSK
jgi:hypothetical protein